MNKYSELVKTLLEEKGIKTTKEAEAFLSPDYEAHTHSPFLMSEMESAVDRILTAVENKEKIAIYSDFDADGIPGGVLLYDFFKKINYENFINYIPHRNTEGYGFHKGAVGTLAKDGVSLIVTVDVGISDVESVVYARKLGVDCIITDHHEVNEDFEELSKSAIAVLNPKSPFNTYPFGELCGAGVSYKLVQALISKGRRHKSLSYLFENIKEGWEKWLLDLVAIATVADMVPLVGENRVLAKWGLVVLRKSKRVGIRALCEKLRIKIHTITEDDIGFMIAPRINAASRMDSPEDAFSLLSTKDKEEANKCVAHLEKLNNRRKGIVAGMVRELKKKFNVMISDIKNSDEDINVIVAGNPEWNPSLCGLAAGSLAEEFKRTICIWGREGTGAIKGSCRSCGNISIVEMFENAKEQLLGFGGHKSAGGFSVSYENVHILNKMFQSAYNKASKTNNGTEIKKINLNLTLSEVSRKTLNELSLFAPFGQGNEKPVFLFKNVEINRVKRFGKQNNHIEISVSDSTRSSVRAFAFFSNEGSFDKILKSGETVNLLATLEESRWNGRNIELRIINIV